MASWNRNRLKNWIGLALSPFVLIVLLRWFENRQVYHPSAAIESDASRLGRPWEVAEFVASDGPRLHGWFFPAATSSPRRERVLLHCHGNGGNVSHRLDVADALLSSGVGVLLFDYRGYGRSEGHPSEEGTYRDAQAAYGWLREKGFAATNILVFGESLGGAVAVELARREAVGGLILQSTFTSVTDLGAELFPFLPVQWLGGIRYDTLAKLPRVEVPVLLMHSREDTLIRFAHAERNFGAARDPRSLVEIAGDHNDFLEAGRAEFVAGFEGWLREQEGLRGLHGGNPSP